MGDNKNSENNSKETNEIHVTPTVKNSGKSGAGTKRPDSGAPISAIIATAAVVLLAAAAVIVLLVLPKNKTEESVPTLPDGTTVTFRPSQGFIDECGAKAKELIHNNYTVVRLFVSEGLSYKPEPYGNSPEDGYYTVNSDEYKVYKDIEELVKSVYVEQEAQRILTQMPADPGTVLTSNPGGAVEHIAVFGTREILVDADEAENYIASSEASSDDSVQQEPSIPDIVIRDPDASEEPVSEPETPSAVKVKVLGINEKFKPYKEYDRPWGSISLKILPTNENECYVTVYLGSNKDIDISSVDDKDILTVTMVRENGEWRLTKLIY